VFIDHRQGFFMEFGCGRGQNSAVGIQAQRPPLEALVGLDAALKAAQVELALYFPPPSETNYAGGLLAGDEASCRAASDAFSRAVLSISLTPISI
jgi:ethanolamine utilization protein EutL